MSGQLSDRDLIRGLLKLDDLLVDESGLFVDHEIRVQRTLWGWITGYSASTALSG